MLARPPDTHIIATHASSLQESVFILNSQMIVVDSNPAFAHSLGLSIESIQGRSYLSLFPNAIGSACYLEFRRRLKDGGKGIVEDFCLSRGLWHEFRISPCEQGIAILELEISARKESEISRKLSEQRALTMIENSAVAFARLGLDGNFLSANFHCTEITGYTAVELCELSWCDLCSAEERVGFSASLVEMISERATSQEIEQRIVRKHGLEIWIQLNITLVRSSSGHPLYYTAVFFDISKRKTSEASLQFALQAAEMGEWDYDAMENCTSRSARFNHIFGYDKAPTTWTFDDFIAHTHPDDQKLLNQGFNHSINKGSDLNLEIRILRPRGDERWISLRAQTYVNQLGRVVRMAGLVTDVTRMKISGLELQNAKLAAEEANREKSNFLANMSHEIRTPLGAIIGFTDALQESGLVDQDRRHYLNIVKRNGHALASLIDDILDLSKVEAGHLEIENGPTHLSELVSEVATLLKVKADAKGLEIKTIVSDALPAWCATDRIRLRQILINVVGNAIKFTAHGRVQIELTHSYSDQGPLLISRVSDTGLGITEKEGSRLFSPFVQADNSTSRQFGGTGLGLALSRRLARAMGGDLVLESSAHGIGSTFRLQLPLLKSAESLEKAQGTVLPSLAAKEMSIDGVRVLLAEDCLDNQELIKRLLDKVGTRTLMVGDGHEAVSRALSGEFDVVLMDMHMPGLDGYQATRTLREAGFKKPIIALTANAMRHDRDLCLKAGCTDYLSKPINPDSLYQLIGHSVARLNHH